MALNQQQMSVFEDPACAIHHLYRQWNRRGSARLQETFDQYEAWLKSPSNKAAVERLRLEGVVAGSFQRKIKEWPVEPAGIVLRTGDAGIGGKASAGSVQCF